MPETSSTAEGLSGEVQRAVPDVEDCVNSSDVLPPVEWRWRLTLADQTAIDALPDDVRAAVERYIRSNGAKAKAGKPTDEYVKGWEDGVEAMRYEIAMAPTPKPPSSR
jgi:hypothetical protein